MKAIFIKEYVNELADIRPSLISIPTPQSLPSGLNSKSHLIRVRVAYTSPTHVDTLYARGLHQNNHAKLVHPPFVLGTEFSGYIDAIYDPNEAEKSERMIQNQTSPARSSTGREFHLGDRVWGAALGSFAPYLLCPAATLYHLPESLSLFDAAALGATTAPVSYGALVRLAQLRKGETCLVHAAAGGLGVAAVMIAKSLGANVIGTVGSDMKRNIVQDMLRDDTGLVPHGSGVVKYDEEGWDSQVLELTGGKGVDVVFDTVGLVGKSIRCCRFGGRIVVVGFVGRGDGKNGVMEQVAMNRILLKGVKVLGYRFGETSRQNPQEGVTLWEGLTNLLSEAKLKPVVYKHYHSIEHIPQALQELASRQVYGKIVIEITEADIESAMLRGDFISPQRNRL